MMRRALVTGAARGIGAAIVSRLLADGYAVLAADLPGTARPPPQEGRRDLDLDVADASGRAALAGALARDGLDVLVNNAGVFARTPLTAAERATEAHILRINAAAVAAMTRAFAPLLRAGRDAAVVNVASVRGLTASEAACAYSLSKALVIDTTRRDAALLAPGVRVNAVAPGDIATGMTPTEPEVLARLLARIPLGRFGRPDEVASVVAFLCGPAARAISGAVLPVDGGFLAT